MTKPDTCVNILYFSQYVYDEKYISGLNNERRQVWLKKEDEVPLFNDFQIVLTLSGGQEDFTWISASTIKEAMSQIDIHKRIFKGEKLKIRYAVVKRLIKGLLPIRSLDAKKNFVAVEWVTGQMHR